MQTGRGLVCNTPSQVVTVLRAAHPDASLAAINEAEPAACAVVDVQYFKGAQVATIRNGKGTFAVTAILVVAFITPQGAQAVTPVAQFTMFPVKEMEA
jgi:hypothetical protein